MKNHSFSNTAILRTPLKEVETDITWDKIQAVFNDKLYREALFVASPNLYDLLKRYEQDPTSLEKAEKDSLQIALYKYYSRFSNRCTPFGLYAFVSTLGLAKENNIQIEQTNIRKATKFDTFFLAKLLAFIDKQKAIRQVLNYYPNTSIYTVSDKFRYVEFYFKKEMRLHKISGVNRNNYLDVVVDLAKKGAKLDALSNELSGKQASKEQIEGFLHTLIDNQFLVSELGITLSGEDYLTSLMAIFKEERFAFFEAQQILSLLIDLKQRLNKLEASDAVVEDYLSLFEYVNEHFDKVPVKKLVQVDGYRDIGKSTLSYSVLKQLRTAVQVVNKLSSKMPESNLERFAKHFAERYEENEWPLTEALDPDIGVNFSKNLGAKTPLVEGLAIQASKGGMNISWDKQQSMLFQKLLHAYQTGEQEIVLNEADVNAFEENEAAYCDTFSVFFNTFSEGKKEKIYLKTIWGPTAVSLIGRFCHLDESVNSLAEEIFQKEEELNKGKIVAEVIHLPQARTGNVLHRKTQRSYEIPYLGQASVDINQQISVADLMVSVKNGKVILRSKSLNKEVVPRLSNAHNYSADALPIYHFLCELAQQGSKPIGFSWGRLQYEYPFLPRVSFKNIVISRAAWMINHTDIKALTKNRASKQFLTDFLKNRKIPTIVSLTKGDNEVVINFSNELSCQVFYGMIKNKGIVELKEFFFQEPSITGSFANEFIVSAYKNVEKEVPAFKIPVGDYKNEQVSKIYSIGDEWLYYKFYCGDKIAEKVLNEAIYPIVNDLKTKNLIEKWFFIRYRDKDGFHIRFRMKLTDKNLFSKCINSIKYHIAPLEKEGIIWKTQVDTYLRETERYGFNSINATESVFYHDSDCTLQFCSLIEGESGERVRWLFSLLSMDQLLCDFGLSLEAKAGLMKMLKIGFGSEFKRKGLLNKQINELYTKDQEAIANFLDKDKTHQMYYPLWELLSKRSEQNKEAVEELQILEKEDKLPSPLLMMIIPSYLHMICNRVFLNKQRIHEMVVYDFMYKYYSKQLHTQKRVRHLKLIKCPF